MKHILLSAILALMVVFAFAQPPYLLKDAFNGPGDGVTTFDRIVYGNDLLFVATTISNGSELWRTNGMAGNTALLKDIAPGTNSSHIRGLYKFDNHVFFSADDGSSGYELWRTNGTNPGTSLLKDIGAGGNGGFEHVAFEPVWVHDGFFFFLAETNGSFDFELWKSDGTTIGTVLVKDILPGITSSNPKGFYEFNNELFFQANDSIHGIELWKTDGTANGTLLVKDIRAGTSGGFDNSSFQGVWIHDGSFFFLAETNDNFDKEIWKSDGTDSGTVLVKDIFPGAMSSNPVGFYEFNDELFFQATDSASGAELWKTDGSSPGTLQVKDIRSGAPGGFDNNSFKPVWSHGSEFFFTAATSDTFDIELWKSDGSDSGTFLLKDIWPGVISGNPKAFYEYNNKLFFQANNGVDGAELWKTDGSSAGTEQVKDILAGNAGGFDNNDFKPVWIHDSSLFFTAETNSANDFELWISDGTMVGTQLVKDIQPGLTSSNPQGFYAFGNNLLFEANDGLNGAELWKTNGTIAGTQMIMDIRPGIDGGFDNELFSPFIEWFGSIYFRAETKAANDNEIWKSDGTGAGTVLIQEIDTSPAGSKVWGFTILDSTYLVFAATNGPYGQEPWAMNMPGLSTEIKEDFSKLNASVFPNPSDGRFTLVIKADKSEATHYEVIDMCGKIISHEDLEPSTFISKNIDLTNLEKGIYLLQVISNSSAAVLRLMIY